MMREEFEKLIGEPITPEAYAIVETVYMHHPSLCNSTAKEEVTRAYKMHYLIDMYPRAKAICEAAGTLERAGLLKATKERELLKAKAILDDEFQQAIAMIKLQEECIEAELAELLKGAIL